MQLSKKTLRDIKYFTFLGAATLVCVTAVLTLAHLLSLALGVQL